MKALYFENNFLNYKKHLDNILIFKLTIGNLEIDLVNIVKWWVIINFKFCRIAVSIGLVMAGSNNSVNIVEW